MKDGFAGSVRSLASLAKVMNVVSPPLREQVSEAGLSSHAVKLSCLWVEVGCCAMRGAPVSLASSCVSK